MRVHANTTNMDEIVDIKTAVMHKSFGVASIARLNEAVKKRIAMGEFAPTEFVVSAACVVDGHGCNAFFTVSTNGALKFQKLHPKSKWQELVFIQFPSGVAYCDNCFYTHLSKSAMQKCSCCEVAQYCDRNCQKEAWATHRAWCKSCAHLDKEMPMVFTHAHYQLKYINRLIRKQSAKMSRV